MLDIDIQLKAIRGLIPPTIGTKESLSIADIKTGGYLEINSDTYLVTQVHRYLDVKWKSFTKRKKDYWVTELQLLNLLTGEKTFIEWEYDDELEVGLTLSQVKLRDIHFNNAPITRKNLEDIAEEEQGSVVCGGVNFHYSEDDTWAALFYREGSQEPDSVRMYEFSASNGQYLTIELWENEGEKPEREAFTSKDLDTTSVKVLQTSGGCQ